MALLYSALFIMIMRIMDVTVGVIRTLMVVQEKKYKAGILGFIEITIWVLL